MKTIAIISCYDTKHQEIDFLRKQITSLGYKSCLIDISTSANFHSNAEIPREEVAKAAGIEWQTIEGGLKHKLLSTMTKGSSALLFKLYKERKISAVISIGGLQNTIIGSTAMQMLPIGIPKVMVSTVACGQRKFDFIVGTKDITVIPAISDFGGMNIISEAVLSNAVAAIVGMLEYAGKELQSNNEVLIGTTMMGATDGVIHAVEKLQQNNFSVVCCHSTGVGGKVMEELIKNNIINCAMDLTLHEVVYEYYGKGFGYGANNRLECAIEKKIPMVVCPGGIEFICKWKNEITDADRQQKMIWHNSELAHIKLPIHDIENICKIIIDRLNKADASKVVVLIPKQGFRTFSKEGEALYDPVGDKAIIDTFMKYLRKDIPIKFVDTSIIDPKFSEIAANEMMFLIKKFLKRSNKG